MGASAKASCPSLTVLSWQIPAPTSGPSHCHRRDSQSAEQCDSEPLGRIALHRGSDVAVEGQEEARVGVPEPLGSHLRMDTAVQHQGGAGVPQTVCGEAGKPGSFQETPKRSGQGLRVRRPVRWSPPRCGPCSPNRRAHVPRQLAEVADLLRCQFSDVAAMLTSATEDILAFAPVPAGRLAEIWSTKPLERLDGEIKRQTNVVGIFPDNAPVLGYMRKIEVLAAKQILLGLIHCSNIIDVQNLNSVPTCDPEGT